MASWKEKAHRIIGELSAVAYRQANRLPNGTMRKKHVPYSIPAEAAELVDCLNKNDERRAKALFIRQIIQG
jgi:hypothetical protein